VPGVDEARSVEVRRLVVDAREGGTEQDDVDQGFAGDGTRSEASLTCGVGMARREQPCGWARPGYLLRAAGIRARRVRQVGVPGRERRVLGSDFDDAVADRAVGCFGAHGYA